MADVIAEERRQQEPATALRNPLILSSRCRAFTYTATTTNFVGTSVKRWLDPSRFRSLP
jgi:hypothetical protein